MQENTEQRIPPPQCWDEIPLKVLSSGFPSNSFSFAARFHGHSGSCSPVAFCTIENLHGQLQAGSAVNNLIESCRRPSDDAGQLEIDEIIKLMNVAQRVSLPRGQEITINGTKTEHERIMLGMMICVQLQVLTKEII